MAPQRRKLPMWYDFRNTTKPRQLQNFLFTFPTVWNGSKVIYSCSVLRDSLSCISHVSIQLVRYARNGRPWLHTCLFSGVCLHWAILRDEVTFLPRQRKGLLTVCYKSSKFPQVFVEEPTAYEASICPIFHRTWGKRNWSKHTDACLKPIYPWVFHKKINSISKSGHFVNVSIT